MLLPRQVWGVQKQNRTAGRKPSHQVRFDFCLCLCAITSSVHTLVCIHIYLSNDIITQYYTLISTEGDHLEWVYSLLWYMTSPGPPAMWSANKRTYCWTWVDWTYVGCQGHMFFLFSQGMNMINSNMIFWINDSTMVDFDAFGCQGNTVTSQPSLSRFCPWSTSEVIPSERFPSVGS